ncbi:hypothetical protein DM47_3705 [Burkholderia mallei]|nr:hypothetical protein DM49_3670 [Burkholderia mallei]KOT15882.1 hypothetical protein DM47_3705 [Burkholderia mallei]
MQNENGAPHAPRLLGRFWRRCVDVSHRRPSANASPAAMAAGNSGIARDDGRPVGRWAGRPRDARYAAPSASRASASPATRTTRQSGITSAPIFR